MPKEHILKTPCLSTNVGLYLEKLDRYFSKRVPMKIAIVVLMSCGVLAGSTTQAQTSTKYDIIGFKKATFDLVQNNCAGTLTPNVSIDDQAATCKSLIPQLTTMRSNFVGDGYQANFRWADDRMNWQISKVYANMALKYLAYNKNNINPTTCGYVYTWKANMLKMDENPRTFFSRYDKMIDSANSVIKKCVVKGYTEALE